DRGGPCPTASITQTSGLRRRPAERRWPRARSHAADSLTGSLLGIPDPDGVSAVGGARCSPRQGGQPAGPDSHRLAARSDGSGQHARRVYRPPASQTPAPGRRAADCHRAWARLSPPMRRSSPARPGLHGRLLLSVLTTIGLVLAGLTAGFNIVLADRLNGEATGVVQARAAAELAAIDVSRNHIVLPEAPDQGSPDSLVWVFQGSRPLEQPRSEAPAGATANSIAQRAPATADDPSSHIRLVAIPVAVGGRRIGAVVAGVSLAPYDQSRRTALIGSIVLAL